MNNSTLNLTIYISNLIPHKYSFNHFNPPLNLYSELYSGLSEVIKVEIIVVIP